MILLPFSSFIHDAFETFGKYSVLYCFDKCSLYLLLTFAVDALIVLLAKGDLLALFLAHESFLIESESVTGPNEGLFILGTCQHKLFYEFEGLF